MELFRDNVFHYDLVDRSNYFYITTEPGYGGRMVGVLRIKKVSIECSEELSIDMRIEIPASF